MDSLVRFDPFSLGRDFDRLFGEFSRTASAGPWVPRVDVFERDKSLVIRLEMAGIDGDSLDVTIENNTLVVKGTRSFQDEGAFHRKEIFEGEVQRTILLPEGLDTDGITADYQDGMLEVVIDKSPEVLPKKVQVQVNR